MCVSVGTSAHLYVLYRRIQVPASAVMLFFNQRHSLKIGYLIIHQDPISGFLVASLQRNNSGKTSATDGFMFCFRLVVSVSAFARKTGKIFQKKKSPLLTLVGSWCFSCCHGFLAALLWRSEVDRDTWLGRHGACHRARFPVLPHGMALSRCHGCCLMSSPFGGRGDAARP